MDEEIDLQPDLRLIWENARRIGVEIDVVQDGPAIHVPGIHRTTGKPGAGAEVLRQVCDLADRRGVPVEIEYMASEPWLGRYYARFGFEETPQDPFDIVNLRRSPRRSED